MSAQQRLNWASLLSAPQTATVKLQRSPFGPSGQQQQHQQQKQQKEGTTQPAAAAAATPRQQQPPPSSQQANASSYPLLPILLLKVAMPQLDDEQQAT